MFSLTCVNDKSKLVIVSQFIADMSNCFNLKKIVKLSEYNENDYAIDFVFDVKPPHDSLYFFLKKKLNVF